MADDSNEYPARSLRRQLLLSGILAVAVSAGLALFVQSLLGSSERASMAALDRKTREIWTAEYQAALDFNHETARFVHADLMDEVDVGSLMHQMLLAEDQQERARLRNLLQAGATPLYESYRPRGLKQLHFHSPASVSLLRMHKPELYGDSLKGIRPTIDLANTTLQVVCGFEEGRIFNGFRHVWPVFHNDRHVGTVETSFSSDAIVSLLQRLFQTRDYALMVRRNVVEAKVFQSQLHNYRESELSPDYLVDHNNWVSNASLVDQLSAEEAQGRLEILREAFQRKSQSLDLETSLLKVDGVTWMFYYQPIHNVLNEYVGALVALEPAQELSQIREQTRNLARFGWMGAVLLGLLSGSTYFFVSQTHWQRLRSFRQIDKLARNAPGMLYQYQYFPESGRSRFPFSTASIQDIYGVTPEQVREDASVVLRTLHPEDFDRVVKLIRESAENLTTWSDEYRVILEGNRVEWRRGLATPEKMPDGSILWHGFITDITKHRHTENLLKEQRQLNEFILENILTGYWDRDIPGNREYRSPALKRMLGYPEAALPDNPEAWMRLVHPEDLQRIHDAYHRHVESKGEVPYRVEVRFRHRDGSLHWVLSTGKVITWSAEGAPLRMIGCHVEITAQKAAEERLKRERERLANVIEGTNVGTWEWNVQTGEVVFNQRWAEMIGYSLEELQPVTIQTWMDHVHPQDNIRSNEMLGEHFAGKTPHYDFTGRMRHKEGHWIWIHDRGKVISWTEEGKPLMMFGTHYDITGIKQVEEDLLITNQELEEATARANTLALRAESANIAKSAFLASMSHEIRTPMNGVIGMTELLLDTQLDEEQRLFAETARSSADALLKLINDILDFSKIEAGKLVLEQTPFDLEVLLDDTLVSMALSAQRKGLEMVSFLEPGTPRSLVGDPGRLRQILVNLFSNAIKFTSEGSVQVRVRAETVSETNLTLRFGVRDTGMGIPQSKRDLLFERFSQADNSVYRTHGGTGLGLAISKELAELMDGTIGVESEEGKGSEFWFTARFERQPQAEERIPRLPESLGGLAVLAVMGDPTLRETIGSWLESLELIPVLCGDAHEAIELIKHSSPDQPKPKLVLIDKDLPRMSGLRLGQLMRSAWKQEPLPMVLIAPMQARGEPAKHTFGEFAAVIQKPVRFRNLLETCRTVLQPGLSPVSETSLRGKTTNPLKGKAIHPILLAEDSIPNQRVARAFLEKMGLELEIVSNGLEALNILRRHSFSLVLMDIQMPVMDGLEATLRIRDPETRVLNPQIPIIALTAHAQEEDNRKCLDAGMNDFIVKPVRKDLLREVLLKWL